MKNLAQWEFTLREVSNNNHRDFRNSELQETHFHAFYPNTSLLLYRIFLIDVILVFFMLFGCVISLFLYFRMISE